MLHLIARELCPIAEEVHISTYFVTNTWNWECEIGNSAFNFKLMFGILKIFEFEIELRFQISQFHNLNFISKVYTLLTQCTHDTQNAHTLYTKCTHYTHRTHTLYTKCVHNIHKMHTLHTRYTYKIHTFHTLHSMYYVCVCVCARAFSV